MLKSPTSKDCYGLYIAFDGIDPTKHPEGMQWVDKKFGKNTQMVYNHNIRGEISEWYHGAIEKWRREAQNGTAPGDHKHFVSEPTFDPSSNKVLVSVTQVVHNGTDGAIVGLAGADLYCRTLNASIKPIAEKLEKGGGGPTVGTPKARNDQIILFLLSRKGPGDRPVRRRDGGENPRFVRGPGRLPGGPHRGKPQGWTGSSPPAGSVDGCSRPAPRSRAGRSSSASPRPRSMPRRCGWWPAGPYGGRSGRRSWSSSPRSPRGGSPGPIPKLTAAAEAVEAGDYRGEGLNSIASRKDEFGQLARGFQRMVGEVSTREGQLKQAQEDILTRERHYRSLIENGSDVISVLDRDGAIRYESPSILRVLGYEPGELIGLPRFALIHPDDLERVSRAFERHVLGLPGDPAIEYRFRHKDGSWRTLEATSTNLLDDPAVGGLVVNSRDVTERKRAQAELDDLRRRQSEELEARVMIRTAELAQKNEELKAANEANRPGDEAPGGLPQQRRPRPPGPP